MTLKIEKVEQRGFTVFALSGRIGEAQIEGLKELFRLAANRRSVVMDLREVTLVDRAVVRFLVRCEADGIHLENRPAYIREWMEREKD